MSYIGNTAQNINYVPAIDYFNGNGSTVAFTLSRPVASVAAVQAVISNVPQNPGSAFTVSGSTITFTSAPPSGTANIYVYYTSPNTQVVQPGQGTVGTVQLADAAVTTAKLSSTTGTGAVALASLPSFTTTIGVGAATASASGSGITFPATQSPSSDVNTLDDYEEGTWNATVEGITTAGTVNYVNRTGRYTKIGRLVYIEIYVDWNSGSGGVGSLRISGLPFVSANAATYPALAIGELGSLALSANNVVTATVRDSSTYIGITQYPVGGGATTSVPWDASAYIVLGGAYSV